MVVTTSTVVHTKRLLPSLVALLLLSTVMLATSTSAKPAPSGGGVIWLGPSYVNGSEVGMGNTFKVELWVNISTTAGPPGNPGCFAYSYWFSWNDTLLNLTSYNVYPPTDIWTLGNLTVEDVLRDMDGDTQKDRHSYSVTALGTPPGWKDGRKIADYTFKAKNDLIVTPSLFVITNRGFADANEDPILISVITEFFNDHNGNTDTNGNPIPITVIALIISLFIVTAIAAAVLRKKAWSRKRRIHLLSK